MADQPQILLESLQFLMKFIVLRAVVVPRVADEDLLERYPGLVHAQRREERREREREMKRGGKGIEREDEER